MKRYIRSNMDDTIHLSDILTDKVRIIFMTNVLDFDIRDIKAATDSKYLYTDAKKLLKLSDEEIHGINDIETLVAIGRLDIDRLSEAQKLVVNKELAKTVVIDKSDVKAVLELIKSKRHAAYMPEVDKNEDFAEQYDVSSDDMLRYVQKLTVGDYVKSTRNYISKYYGDSLMIFEPTRAMKLDKGITLHMCIYIKIDIEASLGTTVFSISFHEAEHPAEYKPYK